MELFGMKRRYVFLAAAGAALCLLAACAGAPQQQAGAAETRPVVLVHGAWMGAASWDRVAAELRRSGVHVTAVELPGHGSDATPASQLSLEAYVRAVQAALPAQGQATVVGHSMAGMVISALAEREPQRVANLVYVAAYLPQSGDTLYKLAMTDKDSRVGAYWTQADPAAYSPATIRAEGIAEVFCADCSEADQVLLRETHRAEAVPPMATPVTLTAARFGSVPRVYVHTRQDRAVSFHLQQSMVAAAGGVKQAHVLDTSHSPMLTRTVDLAQLIADAARR
jgi:pimeloyl-ACP methyl ester carboxylesterase